MKQTDPRNTDTQPWWRYGHVWLVIGGPAAVVVAALATGWIAFSHQDPVTDVDYYRSGLNINKTLAAEALAARGADAAKGMQAAQQGKAMMPALQGRNHAATPAVVLP